MKSDRKLSANQRKLKDKIVEAHRTAGFQPPDPESFAAQAGGNAAALKDIYEVRSETERQSAETERQDRRSPSHSWVSAARSRELCGPSRRKCGRAERHI